MADLASDYGTEHAVAAVALKSAAPVPGTQTCGTSDSALHDDRIITSFDYPPIPTRSCDWSAYREGYDGAEDSHDPIGYGRTEQAAIENLRELEQMRADDALVAANAGRASIWPTIRKHAPLPTLTCTIDFGEFGEHEAEIEYDAGDDSDIRGKATYFHIHAIRVKDVDMLPLLTQAFGKNVVDEFAAFVDVRGAK